MTIQITDVTLREGNHTMNHQLTADFVASVAKGLDAAGVDIIEVGHGDGLGGSSRHVGFSAFTNEEYIEAACAVVTRSKIGVLMVPGIGTMDHIRSAADAGAQVVRVASHCTEADVAEQHVGLVRNIGLTPIGHLVNCSMATPEQLVEESRKFADYGASAVALSDSVGELLPDEVAKRVDMIREVVDIDIVFHGHNSLGCAVANSLKAIEHGAVMVDGALRGMGGGAGNTQTETLVATMTRQGIAHNVDLLKLLDVVDSAVEAEIKEFPAIDSDTLMLGYCGVYGGYINPIRREAEKLNLDRRSLIQEVGRRNLVAGQEDVVIQAARDLAQR